MAYFFTDGQAVNPITVLGWVLGIVSIAVVLIIGVLLLGAIFRPRPKAVSDTALQRDTSAMAWIYIGVGISTLVLIVCMAWNLATIAEVTMPATAPALTVEVIAHQWWWELRYQSTDHAHIFLTANEIHIPVGQPVRFKLTSADVIHSFWVPKLAGKMDIIPGMTNVTWLEANKPGDYRGQCAVFCGAEHARMAFEVIAESPRDFIAWQNNQILPASAPASAMTQRGQQLFQAHCGACHTIRGTDAAGLVGPDLTHLMSRQTLAAGLLPNTSGNLAAWIANPQGLKPSARMPTLMLSGPDSAAILAYLETLH